MADPSGQRILHVALRSEWDLARRAGSYRMSGRGITLAAEGYIHASTRAQVGAVLAGFYSDLDPAELRLLVLDVGALQASGSPVRWEPVGGVPAPFPHVYGPIVTGAVVAELPIGGTAGAAELPDLTGLDVVPR